MNEVRGQSTGLGGSSRGQCLGQTRIRPPPCILLHNTECTVHPTAQPLLHRAVLYVGSLIRSLSCYCCPSDLSCTLWGIVSDQMLLYIEYIYFLSLIFTNLNGTPQWDGRGFWDIIFFLNVYIFDAKEILWTLISIFMGKHYQQNKK